MQRTYQRVKLVLDEYEYSGLARWSQRELRTLDAQLHYIIKRALETASPAPDKEASDA